MAFSSALRRFSDCDLIDYELQDDMFTAERPLVFYKAIAPAI